MKKPLKIILLVLLFLAVAVGSILGYRWYNGRRSAAAPLETAGQAYRTTSPAEGYDTDSAMEEKDDLASDAVIEETTAWPFADKKSDSKFEAKESVGYTVTKSSNASAKKTTKKSGDKANEKTTKSDSKKEDKSKKKSTSSDASIKAFLQQLEKSADKTSNGHPVKVDSEGVSTEYKKFAVADLNGDGEDELFLYAVSSKGQEFYGNSYIVYDNSAKNGRTTMVADELGDIKFYKSGVYEITTDKYGFTSDAIAAKYGVKNKNSIVGYDTAATPYLKYYTNGPFIDAPSEISAADYKSEVAKLKSGGEVKVKLYDFTSANVEKL